MANIDIENIWDDSVVRIATTDQVLGGETGIVNVQAKQLADREEYLKNKMDAVTNIVQLQATTAHTVHQGTSHDPKYPWPGFENDGILNITAKAENSRFRMSFVGYGDTNNVSVPIWLHLQRSLDNGASWQEVLEGDQYGLRKRALGQVAYGKDSRNMGIGTFDIIDEPNVEIGATIQYRVMVRCHGGYYMRFQRDNGWTDTYKYSTVTATFTAQELPT